MQHERYISMLNCPFTKHIYVNADVNIDIKYWTKMDKLDKFSILNDACKSLYKLNIPLTTAES